MQRILKSLGLVVLLGNLAMADLPTGTFGFDMKSTVKANGTADEQMTYLLKNMSKDIKTITVANGQKVTLEGVNRKWKARKQTFACKKISKNSCEIPAGRGMQLTAANAKHLKLDMPMQNGKKLHLHYSLSK
jgi:hypothetical protein